MYALFWARSKFLFSNCSVDDISLHSFCGWISTFTTGNATAPRIYCNYWRSMNWTGYFWSLSSPSSLSSYYVWELFSRKIHANKILTFYSRKTTVFSSRNPGFISVDEQHFIPFGCQQHSYGFWCYFTINSIRCCLYLFVCFCCLH